MERAALDTLFALLRSAVCGEALTEAERRAYSPALLPRLAEVAAAHDVIHLLALGLKRNDLLRDEVQALAGEIYKAVYRAEEQSYALAQLSDALTRAQIPHLPLKGAVLRTYYPEPWMRTSCDIDILVHHDDLTPAIACLTQTLHYTAGSRGSHDVALTGVRGEHVELHFDLMEERSANGASAALSSVWAHVTDTGSYRREMDDEFFYFYHLAHMAKHFENGGCGIRPFIDLWILRHRAAFDAPACEALVEKGGLSRFAALSAQLAEIWFGGAEHTALTRRMEEFILCGGSYGTIEHRVAALKQDGSRGRYLLSRVFAPYDRLVRYYPILEKHRSLLPLMQVRRWLMLLRPDVAKMARGELSANRSVSREERLAVQRLLNDVGL